VYFFGLIQLFVDCLFLICVTLFRGFELDAMWAVVYRCCAQVRSMLSPILRAKYPAITPEEEAVSVPLQAMAGAIFDAVLVHMMNQLAPDTWQPLREDM